MRCCRVAFVNVEQRRGQHSKTIVLVAQDEEKGEMATCMVENERKDE